MMSRSNKTHLFPENIVSLLPILYVAWADAVLGPSEMELIRKKISGLPFLSEEEKNMVLTWTDPANPPDQRVFHQWLDEMRSRAKMMDSAKKESLAELGMEMASVGGDGKNNEMTLEAAAALEDLENAFGLHLPDRTARLLAQLLHVENRFHPDQKLAASIQKILDEPYGELRRDLRRLFQDPAFRIGDHPVKEEYRELVLARVKTIARYGYGAYAFPEKYGGKEDVGRHMAVFEMLGYHDLSTAIKFGVQFGLFGGAIYGLGTERHHRAYLEAIGKGELLGCFAMTETGHGSNVRDLETTATFDGSTGELIIHTPSKVAGKEYIGNALHGRLAVVFAQLVVQGHSHGVHAVVVPLRNEKGEFLPGVKIEDNGYKMGLNGVDNGRIWFDRVRVPVGNLLDRFGQIDEKGQYRSAIENDGKRFFTMLSTLVAGRICVGLASVSASKVALTIAVRYALKRRQFSPKDGEPETLLMDYPSHQLRLLPRLARTYAAHFALQDLASKYASRYHENEQELESLAAGLKAMATWHATDTIQACREACGGKGYLTENRLPALKGDTDIFTTFEGDNTVLMQLVAKGLLSGFRRQFNDAGFFGLMKMVLSRIGTSISERNPYAIRKTDTEHLLDPDFHRAALEYRTQRLLLTVAQRMRAYLGQHMDPYDAYLRCQDHLIRLSEAHLESVMLEAFFRQVENAKMEADHRMVLQQLYGLYAIDRLWAHRGWFLENDYISGAKSKAIRKLRDKLVRELRPYAGPLVDAFGIPKESLAAEILGGEG